MEGRDNLKTFVPVSLVSLLVFSLLGSLWRGQPVSSVENPQATATLLQDTAAADSFARQRMRNIQEFTSLQRDRLWLPYQNSFLWLVLLLVWSIAVQVRADSQQQRVAHPARGTRRVDQEIGPGSNMSSSEADILVVFSDVDGTLVHYPSSTDDLDEGIIKLPASATGMQGVISSQTLMNCRHLRRSGKRLVLVSGMRTATLFKRIPFLPRADAYCSEAGGRIFYPTDPQKDGYVGPIFRLFPYKGVEEKELESFGIKEDLHWRSRMERLGAAGSDGYVGAALDGTSNEPIPYLDRKGLLWDFAQSLTKKGYVLDTNGYSACFRVNRKQQTRVSEGDFEALLSGKVPHPVGLATSTNLGCVDYYPVESGKRNCCAYLAAKFCGMGKANVLANHAICMCDDDNDLEMALACQHAYIPEVSSNTMAAIIASNPSRFTVTGGPEKALKGTAATEKALELLLEKVSGGVSRE